MTEWLQALAIYPMSCPGEKLSQLGRCNFVMVDSMLASLMFDMFFLGYCTKEKNQRRDKASLLIIRMFCVKNRVAN